MDCRNFKDMLDSYLCQELAVETNHAMLSHAEHCPSCRGEMASRHNLRVALQRACSQDQMSEEACNRLRAMLHAEAGVKSTVKIRNNVSWQERWGLLQSKWALPAMAAATMMILAAVGGILYLQGPIFTATDPTHSLSAEQIAAIQLSEAFMAEAAADHQKCIRYVGPGSEPIGMPEEKVKEFDSACLELEKIAAQGAGGMKLCSAHVCGEDRRFAHLIYKRDGQLISLLVTARDGRAMKTGQLPSFDAALAGWQESRQEGVELDAWQTAKRVVLVVSGLNREENAKLAQTLAMPVVTHLRRVEGQTAFLDWPAAELIANLRGGELR